MATDVLETETGTLSWKPMRLLLSKCADIYVHCPLILTCILLTGAELSFSLRYPPLLLTLYRFQLLVLWTRTHTATSLSLVAS